MIDSKNQWQIALILLEPCTREMKALPVPGDATTTVDSIVVSRYGLQQSNDFANQKRNLFVRTIFPLFPTEHGPNPMYAPIREQLTPTCWHTPRRSCFFELVKNQIREQVETNRRNTNRKIKIKLTNWNHCRQTICVDRSALNR